MKDCIEMTKNNSFKIIVSTVSIIAFSNNDFNDHLKELETGVIIIMSKKLFDRTFSQRPTFFNQNALVLFLEKEIGEIVTTRQANFQKKIMA